MSAACTSIAMPTHQRMALVTLQSRRAMPCPQGTYKSALSNAAGCTKCPTGSTTPGIWSQTLADCTVALPGHQVVRHDPSTPYAEPCPAGMFSAGYTTQPCMPCPLNLLTPSTGSTSAGDCSAPPGHGFYCSTGPRPVGSSPVSTAMLHAAGSSCIMACPQGSYKEGWGRSACVSCGVKFKTDGSLPATSAQQCYLPQGWGSVRARDGSRSLIARKCSNGMYGISQAQHGITKRLPCKVSCIRRVC
jgi:hypothetical protein